MPAFVYEDLFQLFIKTNGFGYPTPTECKKNPLNAEPYIHFPSLKYGFFVIYLFTIFNFIPPYMFSAIFAILDLCIFFKVISP